MQPIYKTANMEQAVGWLADAFAKTHVNAAHVIYEQRIRLRVAMLENKRPLLLRGPREFDSVVDQWNSEGGLLINYRLVSGFEGHHDAYFRVESPFDMETLLQETLYTERVIVIYRPPSWSAHEDMFFVLNPVASQCERFFEFLTKTALQRPKSVADLAVLDALELPHAGVCIVPDQEFEALGFERPALLQIRKLALKAESGKAHYQVHCLLPRIEPDEPAWCDLYRHITEQPSVAGVHFAFDRQLAKVHRQWKKGLRALIRSGAVEKRPTLGVYIVDGSEPDYERIKHEHHLARVRWDRMRSTVDEAPTLSPAAVRRLAGQADTSSAESP